MPGGLMDDLGQIVLVRTRGFTSWMTRAVTGSYWNHCTTVVSAHKVVSAQGDGVQVMDRAAFTDVCVSEFPLTRLQQNKVVAFSLAQVGKPYGTLTYVWIGIAKLLKVGTPRWLEKRLADQSSWICSQLCDSSYKAAGIHLFRDGLPEDAVTPADIAGLFVEFGWTDKT